METRGKKMENKLLTLFPALGLALCLAMPAKADYEFYQNTGTNEFTLYDYMNYDRYAGADDFDKQEWGLGTFPIGGGTKKYFLRTVLNFTTEGHCYEIEVGAPYTHSGDPTWQLVYFWDDNASTYTDLLGFAQKGKVRLYIKNSGVSFYVVGVGNTTHHAGYFQRRKNITEAQCTTGQTTINWLKVINGAQTKGITVR
jgi:hypothetical protein